MSEREELGRAMDAVFRGRSARRRANQGRGGSSMASRKFERDRAKVEANKERLAEINRARSERSGE